METKINSQELRRLQEVQLELLIEIDKISRQNNIIYNMFSGTLLGSVRHKGFIPWDDDIDICMLRDDYNKFLEILEKDLSEKYFLQTHETDKEYIHSFARIRKNETLLIQKSYKDIDMNHGIFIDIFPMDRIEPDTIIGKFQKVLIFKFRKLKRLKIKERLINTKNRNLFFYLKYCCYILLKPFKMHTLNTVETKIATMFNKSKTKYYTLLTDGDIDTYEKYIVTKDEIYHVTDFEFENKLFLGPVNYDKILTRIFGDYMAPPPIEEQKPHHGIVKISFDTTKD